MDERLIKRVERHYAHLHRVLGGPLTELAELPGTVWLTVPGHDDIAGRYQDDRYGLALAHTRFAYSPLWEAVASYSVLLRPEHQTFHLPWVRQVRAAVADLDADLIDRLLQPLPLGQGRFPFQADLFTPFPTAAGGEHELGWLRTTPGAVQADLCRNHVGLTRERFRPLLADPEAAMHGLAELFSRYWECALAHRWSRLRALLEGDVMDRARILALADPETLLDSLGLGAEGAHFAGRTPTLAGFSGEAATALAGHGLQSAP